MLLLEPSPLLLSLSAWSIKFGGGIWASAVIRSRDAAARTPGHITPPCPPGALHPPLPPPQAEVQGPPPSRSIGASAELQTGAPEQTEPGRRSHLAACCGRYTPALNEPPLAARMLIWTAASLLVVTSGNNIHLKLQVHGKKPNHVIKTLPILVILFYLFISNRLAS